MWLVLRGEMIFAGQTEERIGRCLGSKIGGIVHDDEGEKKVNKNADERNVKKVILKVQRVKKCGRKTPAYPKAFQIMIEIASAVVTLL